MCPHCPSSLTTPISDRGSESDAYVSPLSLTRTRPAKIFATFSDFLVRSLHQMPSSQPPLERRKILMKAAVIGIAVALHSLAASARTARDVEGSTPPVAIQNDANGDNHEKGLDYRSGHGLWTRGRNATCGERIRRNRHSRDLGPGPDLKTSSSLARYIP